MSCSVLGVKVLFILAFAIAYKLEIMYQDLVTRFLIIFFDSTVFSQRENLSYLCANFYSYTETLFSHFGNKEYKILTLSAYKSYLLGKLIAKGAAKLKPEGDRHLRLNSLFSLSRIFITKKVNSIISNRDSCLRLYLFDH